MVNFKQLNEELLDFMEAMQLNEMAIYYGTDHGTVETIEQGYRKLADIQEGMYHVKQCLRVYKPVTQDEINNHLFDPIQKGVVVERNYPIVLVWGEADKTKFGRKLEGHGICHILQGHQQDATKALNKLSSIITSNIAKIDKYGNYTIKINNYRFAFMLVNNEDGTPKHAVLITAFIRN